MTDVTGYSRRRQISSSEQHDYSVTEVEKDSMVNNSSISAPQENYQPPQPGLISKVGSGLWSGTSTVVGFGFGTLCSVASTGVGVVGKIPGARWLARKAPEPETVDEEETQGSNVISDEGDVSLTAPKKVSPLPPKSSKGWLSKGKDKDE